MKNARVIIANSALTRRRLWASQELSAVRGRDRLLLPLIGVMLLAVVSTRIYFRSKSRLTDRPLLLNRSVSGQTIDRFNLSYTVSDKDTIWGLAVHYYGSGSASQMERVYRANPDLPRNPQQLKIGIRLQVPVN